MGREAGLGPGTLRVGRFIGRLGVVSLPAVQAGLDLDQRVVRRHVARLETAGWLERAPWVWGEGSVTWLTSLGVESTGLGGLRAIVNGHLFLPNYGHLFSPLVAMISPHWRPSFLPTALGAAGGVLGQGLHPLAGGRLGEPVAVLTFGVCVDQRRGSTAAGPPRGD